MKAIIQRVSKASVSVEGKTVGEIGLGYFVLLGISKDDSTEIAKALASKIAKLRLMPDENQKMNLDLQSSGGSILVVSQFTLYANVEGGNRPSFINAAKEDLARPLYDLFIKVLKDLGLNVQTGQFGAYMNIEAELDGPVTINIEI